MKLNFNFYVILLIWVHGFHGFISNNLAEAQLVKTEEKKSNKALLIGTFVGLGSLSIGAILWLRTLNNREKTDYQSQKTMDKYNDPDYQFEKERDEYNKKFQKYLNSNSYGNYQDTTKDQVKKSMNLYDNEYDNEYQENLNLNGNYQNKTHDEIYEQKEQIQELIETYEIQLQDLKANGKSEDNIEEINRIEKEKGKLEQYINIFNKLNGDYENITVEQLQEFIKIYKNQLQDLNLKGHYQDITEEKNQIQNEIDKIQGLINIKKSFE